MNILWITNIMLPPICEVLNKEVPAVGGWMYSSLKRLKKHSENRCAVATVYQGNELLIKEVEGIRYYLLPLKGKTMTGYKKHLEPYWAVVKNDFGPDVVHIHGSEYPHGLAYVRACGPQGVVVSIQGIISCIARYYAAGIDFGSVNKCLTLRDFLKRTSILKNQKEFEKRGECEIELLKQVGHIIGRTDWDKAHTWALNPQARYHFCGETLRDEFYKYKWNYDKCEPHSIFVSQASYPIKGLHMLLMAMPLILQAYHDAKIYVAGGDPTTASCLHLTSYGMYLRNLITDLNLRDKVIFTGSLAEKEMCRRYLNSNVFVCPSSIENSPNSLGEAQLLEMPYVASFVGGVPEIVNWNPEVLYRFEEYEMLAQKVCAIFAQGKDFKSPDVDLERYSGEANTSQLLSIYSEIAVKDI